MYLLDTNVWLERLLNQEKSNEVGAFLSKIPTAKLFMTDLSFHSIGIILDKLNKRELFLSFVSDIFTYGKVGYLDLPPATSITIIKTIEQFNLDFDDAYQYTASEKFNLTLISFDSDFDRTTLGRKTPKDILQTLT